jgi:hypothetical protein
VAAFCAQAVLSVAAFTPVEAFLAAVASVAVDFAAVVARLAVEAFTAAVALVPAADFTAAGPPMAAGGSAAGDVDRVRQ